MDTKLDGLDAQPNLSPLQKEFCASLSKVIRKPEFDLLDTDRVSFSNEGNRFQLVLPHRNDPALTVSIVLSKNSLHSLRVWDFEFVNVFETVFASQDLPDIWVLKINDLLRGNVFLEKWTQARSILQTRTNRYSNELGKWVIGNATQTKKIWFFQSIRPAPAGKPLPDDAVREEKHVFFCSAHGIPKFSAALCS